MKAITVKQPWASLIVEGIKDIENRTWKCPEKYKGQRVLIHASAKPISLKLEVEGQASVKEIQILSALNNCEGNNSFGAIIGSVEIVDCVINHPSIWANKSKTISKVFYDKTIHISKDWKRDKNDDLVFKPDVTYNWVLANPIKFPEPIPVKGKLGFWDFEPDEKHMDCTNDNRSSHQSCGEKIGCIQDCSQCNYYRFIYDKNI